MTPDERLIELMDRVYALLVGDTRNISEAAITSAVSDLRECKRIFEAKSLIRLPDAEADLAISRVSAIRPHSKGAQGDKLALATSAVVGLRIRAHALSDESGSR